ncbi:programmed cell death protein 5-like [Pomacea canaliculata]|uniref:programmed cell death protein 5-like n=1 Tax=Pomacea canaliculata TaxID=400727 RepID=UPI000D7307C8|nr:programmed cell death protein 5-like [Pomacea canaliculata]
MADDDLESLRTRRMAEMRGQQNPFGTRGDGPGDAEEAERARREKEMRETLISQFLDQSARARLANVKVAKPEKAAIVENTLIHMAQTGQLRNKLSEDDLKSMLENISERTQKKTTVKFDRRRANMDDSDDDF